MVLNYDDDAEEVDRITMYCNSLAARLLLTTSHASVDDRPHPIKTNHASTSTEPAQLESHIKAGRSVIEAHHFPLK